MPGCHPAAGVESVEAASCGKFERRSSPTKHSSVMSSTASREVAADIQSSRQTDRAVVGVVK
jgi:hypothetical protein